MFQVLFMATLETSFGVKKENDQHLKNVKTTFYPWAVKVVSSSVTGVLAALVGRVIHTLFKWKDIS